VLDDEVIGMKKLALICIAWFAFVAFSAFAQDVGRVKLTLPKGEWITVSTKERPLLYSGDTVGKIPAQTTVRVLLDDDKYLLAVVFMRAGEYGLASGATLQWADRCKKTGTEYLDDGTQGSFTKLDCLRLTRNVKPDTWLQKNAKQAYADLEKLGVKYETHSYIVRHDIGTDNGTFINTTVVIPYGTLRGIPEADVKGKYPRMPGVAYGQLLAEAARKSTRTMSGEFVVPAIDYR
jgi:hypothetical protein